jgi:preprotein translocase subunit YajC
MHEDTKQKSISFRSIFLIVAGIIFCIFLWRSTERSRWRKEKIGHLKSFNSAKGEDMKCSSGIETTTLHIVDRTMIVFEDGKWLYFVSHSTHDDGCLPEPSGSAIKDTLNYFFRGPIGDITLAIDEEGNIYENHDHVCGEKRVSVKTISKEAVLSTQSSPGSLESNVWRPVSSQGWL